MDIDLLSKMVKELILDNDRVVLPGLGCFVAEMVPSTFSDKGFTINPPYRRLYFRSRPDQGDELTKLYANGNGIEIELADRIINDFVAELKTILFSKKTVIFPGLGRLRATKENAVFFVADEDLDIYPAGFGLEPISLKTHQESASEVTAAVEGLKQILVEPVMVQATPVESQPEPQPDPEPAPQPDPEPALQSDQEPEPLSEPLSEPESDQEHEPLSESESEAEQEQEPEPQHDPEPTVEYGCPYDEYEKKPAAESRVWKTIKKVLVVMLIVIVVLALLLGAYIAVAEYAPDWLDQILYSQEELKILNYRP